MHSGGHAAMRRVKQVESPDQLSFLADLFGDLIAGGSEKIISFSEVAEKHRRKLEKKAYPIILDNIAHLQDKRDEPSG